VAAAGVPGAERTEDEVPDRVLEQRQLLVRPERDRGPDLPGFEGDHHRRERPQGRHHADHAPRQRRVTRVDDRLQARARADGALPADVHAGVALDLRGLSLRDDLRHVARAGHPARAGSALR